MAFPQSEKRARVRSISEWSNYVTMRNKIAEMANNKWSEYGLD